MIQVLPINGGQQRQFNGGRLQEPGDRIALRGVGRMLSRPIKTITPEKAAAKIWRLCGQAAAAAAAKGAANNGNESHKKQNYEIQTDLRQNARCALSTILILS